MLRGYKDLTDKRRNRSSLRKVDEGLVFALWWKRRGWGKVGTVRLRVCVRRERKID
jgi:hypothetical protein